ncbi:hypothetical protein BGZ95_011484 [Linnemannia exigua]|uniref:F-box domain-containing protein n=1 Tax=Linnemannia exigua TaxID=604196 RepID=A0AAD4DJV4_9FUNG|nr:hypothetical protein BGZ95_011484 [Linnemannia exigua]
MSSDTAVSSITTFNNLHNLSRERSIRNARDSVLVKLPPELLKLVSFYLKDPLDLLRFSYTCHELYFLTTPKDWYSLATYTYSHWVVSCGRADERDWKAMVLRDASLGARLGASLPALPTTSPPQTTSSLTVAPVLPFPQPISGDVTIFTSPAPASITRLPSSLNKYGKRRPLKVMLSEAREFETDPETKNAEGAQWVRMGSPNYNIDRETRTVVAASMITRPKTVPSKSSGGDPRPHDHEILFYNLPDLTHPIARCGSDIWEMNKKGEAALPWYHPFTRDMMQVAQVVEIKHYPKTIERGNMRVVIVIAFGQRARPLVNNATDSHILGVWLMLKVIEVWVPAHPQALLTKSMMNHFCADSGVDDMPIRTCVRIKPVDIRNFESLEPRQNQITMHGRIVKLYSADEPPPTAGTEGGQKTDGMEIDRKKVDCIAIFGTQNSDMASAMVIKKVLFRDGGDEMGKRTYSNKAVSRGVSCMTLFPDHSDYEHLLVLFNQHGRGMVWDWVREKQITQLHMPIDKPKNQTKGAQTVGGDTETAAGINGSTQSTVANPAGDVGIAGAPLPRRRVYYWGVQVSSALEVSFPDDLNTDDSKHNGTFRIVTMADGADDEWESCWWNITSEVLGDPMTTLKAPPIIDRNRSAPSAASAASSPPKPPLISEVKRFEGKTFGACLPEQEKTHAEEHGRPIQFIAYVVWNHYRIGLSSRMGICMMDLEEPESGPSADQQWITFLKNREDLIDIAIFGHNLVVTLKTGHLVWSFYGKEMSPFVSQEGLGLRMDIGDTLGSDVVF